MEAFITFPCISLKYYSFLFLFIILHSSPAPEISAQLQIDTKSSLLFCLKYTHHIKKYFRWTF